MNYLSAFTYYSSSPYCALDGQTRACSSSGLLLMSTAEDTIIASSLSSLGGLYVHSGWESWRDAVFIPEDVRCALESAVGSQGVAALSKPPAATYARVISSSVPRRDRDDDDSNSSSELRRIDNVVERLRSQGYRVTKLAEWHAKLSDCVTVSRVGGLEMDSDLDFGQEREWILKECKSMCRSILTIPEDGDSCCCYNTRGE